jgi:hypothetical protein
MMQNEEEFPRSLNALEENLLLWILPEDRPGYREYRSALRSMRIVGQGKRGKEHYILSEPGKEIDPDAPLSPLFAFGVVETLSGVLSVSIRERAGEQVDVEITGLGSDDARQALEETKRWTYSSWVPSQPCPICSGVLREVEMATERQRRLVLAICSKDKRLWVNDGITGVNHVIPVTNFYNELMLHLKIREPKTALDSRRLFTGLASYSDTDLIKAFSSYNKLRTKISFEEPIRIPQTPRESLLKRLGSLIGQSTIV